MITSKPSRCIRAGTDVSRPTSYCHLTCRSEVALPAACNDVAERDTGHVWEAALADPGGHKPFLDTRVGGDAVTLNLEAVDDVGVAVTQPPVDAPLDPEVG
ncbi:hypothetical protein VTI74DRAFT_880 [Chaetomium olivicolor]